MAEKFVGKGSEFKDGDRRIVFVGDNEIGVFRDGGEFYAYSNFCLHQGGPACEGLTIAKVEERLRPDKTSRGSLLLRHRDAFRLPVARQGIRHEDRRMRLRPQAEAAEIPDRAERGRGLCRRLSARRKTCRITHQAGRRPPRRREPQSGDQGSRDNARSRRCDRSPPRSSGLREGRLDVADGRGDAGADGCGVQALCGAGRSRRRYAAARGTDGVSPTDVMVTASGLLRAANLAVFELGMWQSWTGR